jgi:acetyl-CoA/propionyl-CoA carboxylase, biotin carboxylase, biotin carboxyl carrier protein
MPVVLHKVLIANRGEIAVRVARTCREMGIGCAAVYSDADALAMHVRVAAESVRLPGRGVSETYLNAGAIIAAARQVGADAIHPGYGFLSENPEFAAAVERAGISFVGPPAAAIAAMADKVSARAVAVEAGLPVLPAVVSPALSTAELQAFGAAAGWPVVIKASRGGGGRGMRIVTHPDAAAQALESARAESRAATGDDTVYAEHYLRSPRHVEVQILADSRGRIVALGDRDCSVQRRHQKLLEEAPALALPPRLRSLLASSAIALARRVGYTGAGTVEYLVDGEDFFFLEMNTRIQVEHTVTELVFGLDLVREQLLIAADLPSAASEAVPPPRGHAIEVRVNAEDPQAGFLPAPGTIRTLAVPLRPGVRFDTGYEAGDEISGHFDSLIGKLVVWAPTRDIAIFRLREVIAGLVVDGVPTVLPAMAAVLDHPDFSSAVSTQWFEDTVVPGLPSRGPVPRPDENGRHQVLVGARQYRIPRFATGTGASGTGPRGPASTPSGTPAFSPAAPSSQPRGPQPPGADPAAPDHGQDVISPMQGTVIATHVDAGATVAAGEVLVTVESMKMEHPVRAHSAAIVASVLVSTGDVVTVGSPLVRLSAANGTHLTREDA